jgi:hypothetical protein
MRHRPLSLARKTARSTRTLEASASKPAAPSQAS